MLMLHVGWLLAALAAPVAGFWGNAEPLFTDSFNIEPLTQDTFDKTVLDDASGNVWLIDFYAPWCPHCRHFAPHYEAVADHYAPSPSIHFGAVDCTVHGDICSRYEILGYPALRAFHLEPKAVSMPFSPRPKSFETVVKWIESAMAEKNRTTGVELPDFSAFKLDGPKKNMRQHKADDATKVATVDARADRLRDAGHALLFALETSFFMGTDVLDGARYAAARAWLRLLRSLFPLEANKTQLGELLYRFESQSSWSSDEWRLLVALWKSDVHGKTYPKDLFSRKSFAVCENFTCGIWLLFHELTVAEIPATSTLTPLEVALEIRSFVEHFFGCELCRLHFLKANPTPKLEMLLGHSHNATSALVLWMYHMHNTVNVRVEHDVWPSKAECKRCYSTDEATTDKALLAEPAILKYMQQAYRFPASDADVDRPVVDSEVAMAADGTALKGASTWEAYTPSTPIEFAPFLLLGFVVYLAYCRKHARSHEAAKES
ncbi:hypothetical protein SDRG_06130 [Saprolegnia diclina VS20]|uniref:Sulfhydryl oxidase n=1 Tax=Saprolegnia diclina (strain VS20) TaxID=1156394 RepID=T0QPM4_SAPDV|nr:hypothetical protein SDRG_06130 [Saprolegnia diclina VS20]EQC36696.1 hypothetical protein SDRG_06130 [Saprolegnia diclina VS20]|eukprot:XP_008610117.1 hypothetical protein SDRG_06130 [Saprolegnia diclina VS20]